MNSICVKRLCNECNRKGDLISRKRAVLYVCLFGEVCLQATVEWFKFYKVPTGKPPNAFAFDGQVRDRALAVEIIRECHLAWQSLIQGKFGVPAPRQINWYTLHTTDYTLFSFVSTHFVTR